MGIVLCFVPLILAIVFFSTCFKLKLTHQLIAVLLGLAAVLPSGLLTGLLSGLAVCRVVPRPEFPWLFLLE